MNSMMKTFHLPPSRNSICIYKSKCYDFKTQISESDQD